MAPKERVAARRARKSCWEGNDVDLARLPVQTCWPGDAGPLITWGLTVTRGPHEAAAEPRHLPPAGDRPQQGDHALARAPRRRARFPRPRARASGRAVPGRGRARRRSGDDPRRGDAGARHAVRVPVRGPAARRAHRGRRNASAHDLQVPATRRDRARRPHPTPGDEPRSKARSATTPATTTSRALPGVRRSSASRMRRDPIYHSTYTGKPPDEPAVLGVALNEVFVPLLQKQFPEIVDFYLPPEGCSLPHRGGQHEQAVPGPRQARDVRHLELPAPVHVHQVHRRHATTTSNVRDWKEVIWAHHHARRPGARHD